MGFFDPKFKDITVNTGEMKAKIHLSKFNGRFRRAQIWLEHEIVEKMSPFVPYKTGTFLGKIKAKNASSLGDGMVVTVVPPQGWKLYPGITNSGKPFNWTNPQTKPRWGQYTINAYKPEFVKGVRDIIMGRKK